MRILGIAAASFSTSAAAAEALTLVLAPADDELDARSPRAVCAGLRALRDHPADQPRSSTTDPANSASCATGGHGNGFTYCVQALAAFVITGYAQPAVDQINGRLLGTIPYSANGNSCVPGPVVMPPTASSSFYYLGLSQ